MQGMAAEIGKHASRFGAGAAGAAALAWFGAELPERNALYASGSLTGPPPER